MEDPPLGSMHLELTHMRHVQTSCEPLSRPVYVYIIIDVGPTMSRQGWDLIHHKSSPYSLKNVQTQKCLANEPKMSKPSSNVLTDCSKAVLLLWILFCYMYWGLSVILSSLLLASTLWSPAGKGQTSWLSCM